MTAHEERGDDLDDEHLVADVEHVIEEIELAIEEIAEHGAAEED